MITNSSDYFKMLEDIHDHGKTKLGALITTGTEARFVIDANHRSIIIPPEFKDFLAVQHDHNAENIFFEVDRYFDGVDLSTKTCVIQYVNANKEEGLYPVTTYDLDTVPGKIIFEWSLQNAVTRYVGKINYAVRFYSIEDKKFTYNLNTKIYSGNILDGLDHEEVLDETPAGVLVGLIDRIVELEKEIDSGDFGTSEKFTYASSTDDIDFSSWT